MISIIICSTNPNISHQLSDNIKSNIGTDYEIILIDNSKGEYSIFQAYNIGVKKASGDILCFMHEDILIHTPNWGNIVEEFMSINNIGMLGVAGCNAVFKDGDWRFSGIDDSTAVIQGNFTLEKHAHYYRTYTPCFSKRLPLQKVAILDGVWFCIPKELFKSIKFDEVTYSGFHLYDSDISMQINNIGKDVYLTHDIVLEHFSQGTFAKDFYDALNKFHNKWEELLPFITHYHLTDNEIDFLEKQSVDNLKKRIDNDVIIKSIRNKLKDAQDEFAISLTTEESAIVDKSLYEYTIRHIKNKEINFSLVYNITKNYFANPVSKQKIKVISKFLWYRILHF